MAHLSFEISDNDEDIIILINIKDTNLGGEYTEKKVKETISLNNILEGREQEKNLNTGNIEVNLDFDENGKLMSIELYN